MEGLHLGLREWKDWNILEVVKRDHWVLITNNAIEFRSRYRTITNHPGVVFLLPSVRRQRQLQLFAAALDEVEIDPVLVNQAIAMLISRATPKSSSVATHFRNRDISDPPNCQLSGIHCARRIARRVIPRR